MKITSIETLHGDGGCRVCSYVKVSADAWGSDIDEEALKARPPKRRDRVAQ